ncbi:unnamed protein product, partial [Phaeothamnion confervicola]
VDTPPGWYPDPGGRFEFRYHNGQRWTADVSVHGQRYVDDAPPMAAGTAMPPYGVGGFPPVGTGPRPRRGTAIAAFVVGIVCALSAWIPFWFAAAAVGGIVAIVLGVNGLKRASTQDGFGRGFALAGLILGIVAVLLSIVGFLFTRALLRELDAWNHPGPFKVTSEQCVSASGRFTVDGTIVNQDDERRSYVIDVRFTSIDGADTRFVAVDDVQPGATATWTATAFGTGACTAVVDDITGPWPFGIDPGA